MTYLIFGLFLVGFILPMIARSWRALAWIGLAGITTILGLSLLSAVGGPFIAIAAGIPLLIVSYGLISGFATNAILMLSRIRRFSLSFFVVAIAGFVAVPILQVSYISYQNWRTSQMLASAPTLEALLPSRPACSAFRSSPMLNAVIARQARRGTTEEPTRGIQIAYPLAYLDPQPFRPTAEPIQAQLITFQMKLSDWSPMTNADKYDAAGKSIPLMKQEDTVKFSLRATVPVEIRAAIRLRPPSSEKIKLGELMQNLQLSKSEYADLWEVKNQPSQSFLKSDLYISTTENVLTDFIDCSRIDSVPNPHCTMHFDYRGVQIDARFRQSQLSRWKEIKSKVRDFSECVLGNDS